jgi:hypothetical protein
MIRKFPITNFLGYKTSVQCFKLLQSLYRFSVPSTNYYAPMIYTAPCIMFWMCAYQIMRGSGRGLGPGIQSFLGPGIEPVGECHLGLKKTKTKPKNIGA